MWLVHRWLSGRASLIDDAEVVDRITEVAEAAWERSSLLKHELVTHLGVLVKCVDAGLDDEILLGELNGTAFDERFRTMGALIWLAGVLATDARRMPSVVVDHIGVTDELSLSNLHEAIRKVQWQHRKDREGELAIFSACEHPALFNVFEGVAQRAQAVLQALRTLPLDASLLTRLPDEITDALLRPARDKRSGRPLFETPPLRFRLSDEKVRELLMGRQLYGQPELAIRELYQNALDACRYRRTRREYQLRKPVRPGRRPVGDLPDWQGRITIEQGRLHGRDYIECQDNGVGMTAQILKNTFTNAGERFIYQPSFRAENARWQEVGLELIPNSQFGVGVFSYFMIAEEIEIWTRPTDEDDSLEKDGSFVRIVSSGSLFQIEPHKGPPGGGTVVRLYLNEDRVSVLKTMRRLLWTSEFTVTVREDGSQPEVWNADELRYSGTAVRPLQHGDDFWWVAGEGGLAADGIRTNEERFGLVANLRGRRRPRFTVDRNRLRQWNRRWIDQQVEESLPALAEWSGLTFNWLWNLTEKTPEVGQTIFDWLVEHGKTLSVEGSSAHGTAPPVAAIGCLHLDRMLFSGELSGWMGGSAWLVAWRAAVWRGYAIFNFMESLALPESVEGYPVVRPRDSSILGDLHANITYSFSDRPPVARLLSALASEDESPEVRLSRLRRFAITGVDLSGTRLIPPVAQRFHEEDRKAGDDTENHNILWAVPAWTRPGERPRPDAGNWLVLASERSHLSVREVVARAGKLVGAGWIPPSKEMVAAFEQRIFEAADLILISQDRWYNGGWAANRISPARVVTMSNRLNRSVDAVLSAYDEVIPLGYEVMGRELFPTDLSQVEIEALLMADEMGSLLSALDLFVLTKFGSKTVQSVHAELGRLAGLGFVTLPEIGSIEEDLRPRDDELVTIGEHLYGYRRRYGDRRLQTGWAAIHALAIYIHSGGAVVGEERLRSVQRLIRLVDPARPLTTAEVSSLSYSISGTLQDAVRLCQRLLPETADFSLLPPSFLESGLSFESHNLVSLLDVRGLHHEGFGVGWRMEAANVVGLAFHLRLSLAETLNVLEPYREVGLPIPSLNARDQECLAGDPVDVFDANMLWDVDEDNDYWRVPVKSISALRLVQIAGRFGWTLAQTRARVARYEPLGLTVDIPDGVCDDSRVHWQDLLVVTAYLDGREPALRGVVPGEHLVYAAKEIDETVGQVRERLDRFAPLFGFSISTASDEGIPHDV